MQYLKLITAGALLVLSTTALASDVWQGLKVGLGLDLANLKAHHQTSAKHLFFYYGDVVFEAFGGNAAGAADSKKSKPAGTVELSFDTPMNQKAIFGLIAGLNFGPQKQLTFSALDVTRDNFASGCDMFNSVYTSDCDISTDGSTLISSSLRAGASANLGVRAGFLLSENSLLYLSGGWAMQQMKRTLTYRSQANVNGTGGTPIPFSYEKSVSRSKIYDGYFLGLGLEAKLMSNASIRLEYRYTDFGSQQFNRAENVTANTGYFGSLSSTDEEPLELSQRTTLKSQAFRILLVKSF
jgi:opacity protein-like surface antigen